MITDNDFLLILQRVDQVIEQQEKIINLLTKPITVTIRKQINEKGKISKQDR